MTTLRDNLMTGDTYLTQHSDDPASDGAALDNAFLAIANILEPNANYAGTDEIDPDFLEIIIEHVGHPGLDVEPCDPQTAAEHIDARAKASGGRGWIHGIMSTDSEIDDRGGYMIVYSDRLNSDGEHEMLASVTVRRFSPGYPDMEAKIRIAPYCLPDELNKLRELCLEFLTERFLAI